MQLQNIDIRKADYYLSKVKFNGDGQERPDNRLAMYGSSKSPKKSCLRRKPMKSDRDMNTHMVSIDFDCVVLLSIVACIERERERVRLHTFWR